MTIAKVAQLNTHDELAKHRQEHAFDKEKSFDYDRITDEIFIGTNMCCLHGYKLELLDQGIDADISLEKEAIDNPEGVDYFLWLPVPDKHAPSATQLELGVVNLEWFVSRRMKVYVHCKNGHGRAPTLVAAYFISRGMTVQQAIDAISKQRPEIHLEDEQLAALERFHEKTAQPTAT